MADPYVILRQPIAAIFGCIGSYRRNPSLGSMIPCYLALMGDGLGSGGADSVRPTGYGRGRKNRTREHWQSVFPRLCL